MTAGIRTDKAALVVEELEATDWTKLPPVFLLFFLCFGRFGWVHDDLRRSVIKIVRYPVVVDLDDNAPIIMLSCNRISLG
jgi:hypothetical protein